jgi:hypothetical protein
MKASVLPLLTVVLAPFALHAAIPERPLRQAPSFAEATAGRQDRPNIVVILSDDAGFEEFGIYKVKQGEPSNTPNIDKLGEQGVAFAHCWGQAICGPSRLVRTKDFMLEAVSELYDTPQGRFYQTNDSWDGRGYENVTHNPEFAEQRKRFDDYMAAYPSVLPTSWDDPIWQQPKMQKSTNFFNNPKRKAAHHRLPTAYQFYDPSF